MRRIDGMSPMSELYKLQEYRSLGCDVHMHAQDARVFKKSHIECGSITYMENSMRNIDRIKLYDKNFRHVSCKQSPRLNSENRLAAFQD